MNKWIVTFASAMISLSAFAEESALTNDQESMIVATDDQTQEQNSSASENTEASPENTQTSSENDDSSSESQTENSFESSN